MGEECRHGLANGVCDACFPKARPEVPVAVPSTRASRARTATLSRKAAGDAPQVDLEAQRVYHVTHVDNLESILTAGAVLSDSAGATPSVDISAQHAREARRMITVDDDGSAVADFVPLFLSPLSSAWASVRSGASDPRLSVSATATEFVILVTSVKAVTDARSGADVVIADRDAAHPLAHFATATDASNRMLRKLNAESAQLAIADAEVLVRESVPFDVFSVVTVANDRARNAVKELLRGSSFAPRVAIHPPWFSSEVE